MPEETYYIPVEQYHSDVINDLCGLVNDWATKKGWNQEPDTISHKAEQIALMHSELSECLEFIRTKVKQICPECGNEGFTNDLDFPNNICAICNVKFPPQVAMDDHVPELTGEEAELADLFIRGFHYAGKRGINLGEAVRLKHEYNTRRPFRHGKHC